MVGRTDLVRGRWLQPRIVNSDVLGERRFMASKLRVAKGTIQAVHVLYRMYDGYGTSTGTYYATAREEVIVLGNGGALARRCDVSAYSIRLYGISTVP